MPRAWPVWRLIGVCAVALTTANCAGNNTQKFAGGSSGSDIDPKYGVRASKRLYNEGDVIPKGGGRRFSGKPYVVAGKTYVPRDDARGYVREGLASWYGSAFHGRMTANGEIFDRHSIAAAHPTLPLPSYARVTNLSNGYSMVVRVNDRGPYHAGRVMDLSEEAARALDFHRKGTEHVRVEYIGKASVAGSDDRKLLASLRTDGRPAPIGSGSPVMVADLGPDREEPVHERFSRTTRPTLAYKPAEEDAPEPAPRPQRAAPIVLASAASVAVPAAVQPTAARGAAFKPMPVAGLNPGAHAAPAGRLASAAEPAHGRAPLSLAPPPLRLAGAMREPPAAPSARETGSRAAHAALAAGAPKFGQAKFAEAKVTQAKFAPPALPATKLHVAQAAMPKTGPSPKTGPAPRTAMPADAKNAMARLVASSTKPAAPGPGRRSHLAGVY
ncbi:septal ring lytic transglycosylase RlpA family protein [Methylobacterium gnaphalii]|nr:septal ring lytic transglycosylase RlpA family protein [Methylobacterium gnaphalii]